MFAKKIKNNYLCYSVGIEFYIMHIPDVAYNVMYSKLDAFFRSENFLRVNYQYTTSIMAACEDHKNIVSFTLNGLEYPLPQTNQMHLEDVLLKAIAKAKELGIEFRYAGIYCETASTRDEPTPVEGRHERRFPMFEFELLGNMEDLQKLMTRLLNYMGFNVKDGKKKEYAQLPYLETAKHYEVTELEHEHEEAMCNDFSHVCFLTDFPNYTSPFWNMKQYEDGVCAKKIDVIMYGQETIGSAERSCDANEMREQFSTISNGEYAQTLYDRFGKDRVDAELDEFLSYDFVTRSGGGIGMHRMYRAMKLHGLLDDVDEIF
jgi:aspartyl/asparaginyl-tRNA synthetase